MICLMVHASLIDMNRAYYCCFNKPQVNVTTVYHPSGDVTVRGNVRVRTPVTCGQTSAARSGSTQVRYSTCDSEGKCQGPYSCNMRSDKCCPVRINSGEIQYM